MLVGCFKDELTILNDLLERGIDSSKIVGSTTTGTLNEGMGYWANRLWENIIPATTSKTLNNNFFIIFSGKSPKEKGLGQGSKSVGSYLPFWVV